MRRPSPALAVALLALFVSLGGVGYAAFTLPAGSVGTAQLTSGAVTADKIARGAVGALRINRNSVQARVLGDCTSGAAAISAIDAQGNVTCLSTRPQELETGPGSPTEIGDFPPQQVATETLSGRLPALVLSTPYVRVTGTAGVDQHVEVTCTLAASPLAGYTQTRSATFDLSSSHEVQAGSIPLVITEPGDSTSVTVAVSCGRTVQGGGALPTVGVLAEIHALQTGGNVTTTTTTTTG